jgi:hypothetical protein
MWRDCRLAWRRVRAAPGIAVFSILTLTLGIGVSTATYSVIYAGRWRPLGLADEARLAIISRSNMMHPGPTRLTWAEYQHLLREQRTFSSILEKPPRSE